IDGLVGVTWIDTSTASVTVSVVVPVTPLYAAPIVEVPFFFAAATPTLKMVATLVSDELQVASVVRSFVELSLYTPVAVNACFEPFATDGSVGVTSIDASTRPTFVTWT